MFELNKPGEYTVKLFEEIEEFDKDEYGNTWYNVLFDGDAETYMWLKKDAPVEGQVYYGRITPTKSGKRLRFKTEKRPDDALRSSQSPSKPSNSQKDSYLKDMSNTPILVYNGSLNYAKDLGLNIIGDTEARREYFEYVKAVSDELLIMIDNIRGSDGSDNASPSRGILMPKPAIKEREASATTSLGDKFRARQVSGEHDYGDEVG